MRTRWPLAFVWPCAFLSFLLGRAVLAVGAPLNGIYDIAGPGPPSVAALTSPDVDGIYIHVGWNRVEKTEGIFDWSGVDKLVNTAIAYGKSVELDLGAGRNAPAWVYTDGAQSFSWIWDQPWGPPLCSTVTAPVPWDPIYIAKFKAAVVAMGQQYAANSAVAMVKLTGINGSTDEDQLPRATGQPIYNGAGQIACYSNDDVSNWLAIGYSSSFVISAFADLYAVWKGAFPNVGISAMLTPKGFPLDTGSIATAIISRGIAAHGTFLAQNNGLSSTWLMTSGGVGLSGYQEGQTLSANFSAAVSLALAQTPGPKFLEIYEGDIINPANADALHQAHEAVLLN